MTRLTSTIVFIFTLITSCSNHSIDNSTLTKNDNIELEHFYQLKACFGQEIDLSKHVYGIDGKEYNLDIILQKNTNKYIVLNNNVCPTCFQDEFKRFIDQNPSFNSTFDVICHFDIAKSIISICEEIKPDINIFLYNESPFKITNIQNYIIIIDDEARILCALPFN